MNQITKSMPCEFIKVMKKTKHLFLLSAVLWVMTGSITAQAANESIKLSNDLELIKISEHSYIHISYMEIPPWGRVSSNGLIYINNNKAYILDTPGNDALTKILISWLKDSMKLEIEGVVVTHWHDDRMGGLNEVHKYGIKSYSHKLTGEIAKSKNLPIPKVVFQDSLTLGDNNEIICKYLGAAHTVDNIVVWIPDEKILFGGCMIKELKADNLGNIADADINAWPKTLKTVRSEFSMAKIVIPGHGLYGGIELIDHTIGLLEEKKK
jgi:metallo-beta-lactamase class B